MTTAYMGSFREMKPRLEAILDTKDGFLWEITPAGKHKDDLCEAVCIYRFYNENDKKKARSLLGAVLTYTTGFKFYGDGGYCILTMSELDRNFDGAVAKIKPAFESWDSHNRVKNLTKK